MQPFWRSQFDKVLIAGLFLSMSGLGLYSVAHDKVSTFALQAAAGLLGCLVTLVTGRKAQETMLDPTSATTKTTIEQTASTEPKV